MNIKDWVRSARQHAGLTQAQLGEALNVTKGNVSGWENGRHNPSYEQIRAIAQRTGVPLPDSGPADLAAPPALGPPQGNVWSAVMRIVTAFADQDQAIRNAAAELLAEAVRRPEVADVLAAKLMKLSDEPGGPA
ncbi:helix-turn-helix transcriptional regulator [Pseudorhodoferax sp.]|uniref:helix-turn-helix transcriptional regulator n=1 Tax=Pseudorhodoferax sp. TaxID=1993553 RepID=UPI0039E36325